MIFLKTRCYKDLRRLKTFKERYNYLKLDGVVGESTFGFDRYLNQVFYKSGEWRHARDVVIRRDEGCDLGIPGHEILGESPIIHHMNPITQKDVLDRNPDIFNPEYLICVSSDTHRAIHFGDENGLPLEFFERHPNDTCPWKE